MRVYLREIRGIADSMVSLLMSKRSWTLEREIYLRGLVISNTDPDTGFPKADASEVFWEELNKVMKYGCEQYRHTTLLRFIDLSFVVEGLHRGAQDDFDSHAARLNNRIVRSSTRLATFSDGEKSAWYEDKIRYPFEVFAKLGIEIPEEILDDDGFRYVKTDFGYVREDLAEDNDSKRGLYPLAIPSNFIFKVQYPELCHIVQHRDHSSEANPELKLMIEDIKAQLTEVCEPLGRNLTVLKMQP
jgi:hypothetical protein